MMMIHHHHVEGVRLRLRTAATESTVHPSRDIGVWRPWWNGIDKGNSRFVHQSALWQSYQQSYLVGNREDLGEANDGFCPPKISFLYSAGFFNMLYNLPTWGLRFYFPSKGRRAVDLYRP
jgi:hypothetical protein